MRDIWFHETESVDSSEHAWQRGMRGGFFNRLGTFNSIERNSVVQNHVSILQTVIKRHRVSEIIAVPLLTLLIRRFSIGFAAHRIWNMVNLRH